MMSDIPRCPRGPGRPPRGSVPFVPVPWPRPRPPSRLPVLSVNGLVPDRGGDVSFAYVDSASYEPEYGDPPAPAILLKHGETVVAAVDASAFVIDGMVDDVEVTGGNLVITFNTAAGKRPISIPLTLFFDPSEYYDKEAADARFALRGEVEAVAGDVSALQTAVSGIGAKIPAQASADNQLADKEFVNSSVATNTANFLGTYSYVADLGFPQPSSAADVDNAAIAAALGGLTYGHTPTNNDYAFVSVNYTPTTDVDEFRRFKFNDTTGTWGYEYTLNNSSFTEAQWAAINSGITSGLVAKLGALPTAEALAQALAAKQDALTFDNAPTTGSNNPVTSGGIWSTVWGALAALPTGFMSLYDWCVSQLARKLSSSSAAPAFDATRTAQTKYNQNEIVSKDGVVYQCTNASGHYGAWNASNWEAKPVSDLFLPLTGGEVSGDLIVDGRVNISSFFSITRMIATGFVFIGRINNVERKAILPLSNVFDSSIFTIAFLQNLAPDYNATSIYELNNLCVHNGRLYRCTTAITTAEAWTAAHWTEAMVEDVLSAIRSALAEKANRASPATAGNLAALDANGNPTDSTIPAASVAVKSDLRYSFNAATVSSGTTPTVTNLADRAINTATLGSTVTAATVTLPDATANRARDFFIDLTIEATTAPTLTFIDPATNTTANVTFGADSLADIDTGKNAVLFTEFPNHTWIVSVKHEGVSA